MEGTKLRSTVAIEVAGDAPHRLLTEATDRGLAAANAALAEAGRVEAVGSLGSVKGGLRRVKVELVVRLAKADMQAAMGAEAAFAEAFVARLRQKGHHAERA